MLFLPARNIHLLFHLKVIYRWLQSSIISQSPSLQTLLPGISEPKVFLYYIIFSSKLQTFFHSINVLFKLA